MADLGLDSLMSIELRNRLQSQLPGGITVPTTLAFDYPTVTEVAQFLLSRLEESQEDRQAVVPLSTAKNHTPVEPPVEEGGSEAYLDLVLWQKIQRYGGGSK
jgi:hypothetical protein